MDKKNREDEPSVPTTYIRVDDEGNVEDSAKSRDDVESPQWFRVQYDCPYCLSENTFQKRLRALPVETRDHTILRIGSMETQECESCNRDIRLLSKSTTGMEGTNYDIHLSRYWRTEIRSYNARYFDYELEGLLQEQRDDYISGRGSANIEKSLYVYTEPIRSAFAKLAVLISIISGLLGGLTVLAIDRRNPETLSQNVALVLTGVFCVATAVAIILSYIGKHHYESVKHQDAYVYGRKDRE